MSNLCSNLFKVSDVVSGGVFGISILNALLAFIVQPVSLIVTAIVLGLDLGNFGFIFAVAFIFFTYLTFRHKLVSLFGHFFLVLLLALVGSGISYLYTALFLIYLMPYIAIYCEVKKDHKSIKVDAQ